MVNNMLKCFPMLNAKIAFLDLYSGSIYTLEQISKKLSILTPHPKNKVLHIWNQYFNDLNKFLCWKSSDLFLLENLQMRMRGKKSTVNSWEGMTVDSLSSSNVSSERDNTRTAKAVNNAVRLISRISKPLMKDVIYTEIWISVEMSQCCNCVSHFLLFMKINWETNLRVVQIVIVTTMHSRWHNFRVVWGMRGVWNGSNFFCHEP